MNVFNTAVRRTLAAIGANVNIVTLIIWLNNINFKIFNMYHIIHNNWFWLFFITSVLSVLVLIYWIIKDFNKKISEQNKQICYLWSKCKFYDIAYNKYLGNVQSGTYSMKPEDIELFDSSEREYLQQHISELENLYIIQRGRNKIFGVFQKPFS